MKKSIFATLALSFSVFGLAALANAFTPQVILVAPDGTQTVSGFPTTVTAVLDVSLENGKGNCITDGINFITVTAQKDGEVAPTTIYNVTDPVLPQECPTRVSFPWKVENPGTYSLIVTLRHGNDYGGVEESIDFLLVAVEYPAPPAVANAYMNSLTEYKKQFSSKVRGCIISQIAELHAKDEYYGPKGGPYDKGLIESDVRFFSTRCGGPTIIP